MASSSRLTAAQRNMAVQRRFAKVGQRLVHYRKAGSGPPIVLIHQSPKSSAELIGMIRQLAANFTVFAPDTPGYGFSDPLASSSAGIDDFVDALVALFDELGLDKPAVFGSHSGAIFGVRLAARYPHKLSALIANGVLINDQATRDDLVANYFPDFTPGWDGSHLPAVWSRIRDQHCFYPWYQRSVSNRIHWPASITEMHESAMEILLAGEHYKTGYRAVLDYDITPDLSTLRVPTLLVVAEGDALVNYVPLYPPLQPATEVKVVAEFSDIPQATQAFAQQFSARSAMAMSLDSAGPTCAGRRLINFGTFAVHYLTAGNSKQPVVLLLHDIGQSAAQHSALINSLAEEFYVIAPDLSGHGQTDVFSSDAELISEVLQGVLSAGDIASCTVLAMGTSLAYAQLLAVKADIKVTQIIACKNNTDECVPDLTPDYAGTQFLKAWYFERDKTLFSPWHLHSENTMLATAAPPIVNDLQQRALDRLISANESSAMLADLQQLTVNLPSDITVHHVESNDDPILWLKRLINTRA